MRKNVRSIVMTAAAILAMSCQQDEEFTVNKRTPQRVEFRQREIPEGFEIGASRPASAEPVDLGLSVMWSNMNLGATRTDQYGEHFAWGEIAPSHDYGWHNYEFNDFHADDEYSLYITKYCFDRYGERQDLDRGGVTLDMYDDAAYMQWGEGWRMPTDEEITELSEKCTWTYITERMTFTVTGPNGNSIIIPFEGVGIGSGVYVDGGPAIPAGFWTSTLSENESPYAVQLVLEGLPEDEFNKGVSREGSNRCFGCYIRPVMEK